MYLIHLCKTGLFHLLNGVFVELVTDIYHICTAGKFVLLFMPMLYYAFVAIVEMTNLAHLCSEELSICCEFILALICTICPRCFISDALQQWPLTVTRCG